MKRQIAIGLMALVIFGLGYRLYVQDLQIEALSRQSRVLQVWKGCIELLGQKNGQATVADMEICNDYP